MAHLEAGLTGGARATLMDDRALLALQGPKAAEVMAHLAPGAEAMKFMSAADMAVAGIDCFVSRSGYTGEDGYEISVAASGAEALARKLLAEPEVAPIGLGARDTLRLEAGLCLYGHDIDTTTTPVEAGLAWTISKRRRAEGGFPGAARISKELAEGPARKRVGIRPEGRAPARDGTAVSDSAGHAVGTVTSGGFSPSLAAPIAMGYVVAAAAAPGTALSLDVRGRSLAARVADLPFVPHRYHKG
jgi:aminomethyltransferase